MCTGTDILPAGGGGGGGIGGGGANGGSGGQGGAGGSVWIIYNSSVFSSPSFTNFVSAGSGGGHGTGASGGSNGADGSDGIHIDVTTCAACSPSYGYKTIQIVHSCACDDAMRVLATMDTKTTSGGGSIYNYTLSGGSTNICTYDNTYGGLESYEYSPFSAPTNAAPGIKHEDIYLCPYAPGCAFMGGIAPPTGAAVGSDYGWGGPSHYTDGWYPHAQTVMYNIYSDNNNSSILCSAACWDQNGEDGTDGANADDGAYTTTPDNTIGQGFNGTSTGGSPGAIVDDPLGPVSTGKSDTPPLLSINPNPVNDMLNIGYNTLNEQQNYALNVIDVKGQVVITLKFSATQGQNTYQLNTATLAPGAYTLQLISNNQTLNAQFIKQ